DLAMTVVAIVRPSRNFIRKREQGCVFAGMIGRSRLARREPLLRHSPRIREFCVDIQIVPQRPNGSRIFSTLGAARQNSRGVSNACRRTSRATFQLDCFILLAMTKELKGGGRLCFYGQRSTAR